MKSYGSETHGLRREERALVASQFPPVVQYRRVLTPYEQQKAEAGQLFYGNANATSDDPYRLVRMGLLLFIGVKVLNRLSAEKSFSFYQ